MSAAVKEPEVKERPILFSGPMVRAILEGRKTQTRRVAKVTSDGCKPGFITPVAGFVPRSLAEHVSYCPYGWVGDRIWVRETWQAYEPLPRRLGGTGPLASAMMRIFAYPPVEGESIIEYKADRPESGIGWRSSIHLPRWASRITLEITNVRVERLQEISERDAQAEGVRVRDVLYADEPFSAYSYVAQFKLGWDSINAKRGYSWESNPWCWVLEFRKL